MRQTRTCSTSSQRSRRHLVTIRFPIWYFGPGEYFGDGDNQRELTPELMADAVLERYAKRQSR